MEYRIEEKDGKTVVTIDDEQKLFFRMGDERDYSLLIRVDGKGYRFSSCGTDCPFAKVSLTLHENTNKRTLFTLTISFDRIVSIEF